MPRPLTLSSCGNRTGGTLPRWLASVAILLSLAACNPLSSGSFGNGTPPPDRNRGTLLTTVKQGRFEIEIRKYGVGKGSHSSDFCDYWISFDGKPFEQHPDLDHYNSCHALLLLADATPHLFLIGAYQGSGGDYVPVFFGEQNGQPYAQGREECELRAGQEGAEQAWKGWRVEDGHITLCDRSWQVSPDTPNLRQPDPADTASEADAAADA